ncbi:DUF3152 domain-containing protein [Streptomyces sp. NPDC001941]|uniref:DUF3152 domain-containing protein n=1 Tax=Streptomyces sp. NPDC001941 TaxID=3154659 RepID=UPI0033177089
MPGIPDGAAAAPQLPGTGRRRRAPGAQDDPGARERVRGGHPEHHEPGGGWGAPPREHQQRYGDWHGTPRPAPGQGERPRVPGQRQAPHAGPVHQVPAPVPAPRREAGSGETAPEAVDVKDAEDAKDKERGKGGKGRTLTGIAAAAVTTVLAVVVAGQVAADDPDTTTASRAAGDAPDRAGAGPASRSDDRKTPQGESKPAVPATYEQLMAAQFPIDPKLKASGQFETVPGFEKAPGKGERIAYRIDVEKGLGLDGALFAKAVQRTLNDPRSWAHGGARTFERVSSGDARFVITLASPGTTAVWCAKSGLDTSEDNVSCDSAATPRVMINAFRWAQGSPTYGAKAMFTYRQMLINHEVGHRLGHGHVNCRTPGALAPVMQQQTKSLDIDGITCKPNPWVYPTG